MSIGQRGSVKADPNLQEGLLSVCLSLSIIQLSVLSWHRG